MTPAPARRGPSPTGPARQPGQPGPTGTEIRLIPAQDLARHLPSIADVGGRCFTRPPWHEPYPAARSVASRALADSRQPGFVLALAQSTDQVYGFAYGHRCSTLAHLAAHPPGEDFTLKELAVIPELRGLHLGLALHDTVLTAAQGQPHWLSTHIAAQAAIGLYRRRGWRPIALHEQTRLIMQKS